MLRLSSDIPFWQPSIPSCPNGTIRKGTAVFQPRSCVHAHPSGSRIGSIESDKNVLTLLTWRWSVGLIRGRHAGWCYLLLFTSAGRYTERRVFFARVSSVVVVQISPLIHVANQASSSTRRWALCERTTGRSWTFGDRLNSSVLRLADGMPSALCTALRITRGRESISWQRCNTLCTSGLWMTSCFHITRPMGQNQCRQCYVWSSSTDGSTCRRPRRAHWGEVCYPRLLCCCCCCCCFRWWRW